MPQTLLERRALSLRKESLRKESLRKESLRKESLRTDLSCTVLSFLLIGCGGGNGGSDDGSVHYLTDVRPIFSQRCTYCHHENSAIDINIADPFNPQNGLVGSANTWAEAHPEGNTPAFNVVPFEPENSFLMDKISNPNIDVTVAGEFMPWQIPRLTDAEIATLRQWISDSANNDDFFQSSVRPIFGNAGSLGAAGGKCTYCHHSDGVRPNLSDPFDPANGLVNVTGTVRPDLLRVEPGSPDTSLIIIKVEATDYTDENGSPMPMHYDPLTAGEIETVRQWIAEGAQNN